MIKTPHIDTFHPHGTIEDRNVYHCGWLEQDFFDQTMSNARFSDLESVDKSRLSSGFSAINWKRTDILGHLIY